MASTAEAEIRDFTVDRLRLLMPDARIIHELAVGGCRIDVAAVDETKIVFAELKSEKDTLKRLRRQATTFIKSCDLYVTVAHRKFWDHSPYTNGAERCAPSKEMEEALDGVNGETWAYPHPGDLILHKDWDVRFHNRLKGTYVSSSQLLWLLWVPELRQIAKIFGFKGANKMRQSDVVRLLHYKLTGEQVVQSVCAAMRAREVAWGDAPIGELWEQAA